MNCQFVGPRINGLLTPYQRNRHCTEPCMLQMYLWPGYMTCAAVHAMHVHVRTRLCTGRVPGRLLAVYTAVYGSSTQSCLRASAVYSDISNTLPPPLPGWGLAQHNGLCHTTDIVGLCGKATCCGGVRSVFFLSITLLYYYIIVSPVTQLAVHAKRHRHKSVSFFLSSHLLSHVVRLHTC